MPAAFEKSIAEKEKAKNTNGRNDCFITPLVPFTERRIYNNENMTIEKKTQTEDTNKGTLTLDAAYAPKTGVVRLLLMMENQYHAIFVVSGEQEYREKQLV